MDKFDYFGSIVGLSYKGHRRYNSAFGGVIFMIVCVISLSTVIYFSKIFLERENPDMTIEEVKDWFPPEINGSDLKFVVMMKYNGSYEYHPDVFKIEVVYKTINFTSKIESEEKLETKPCTKDLFPEVDSQYTSLELEKGICVNSDSKILQGSYVNEIIKFISIKFTLCLKGTDCLPSEKLSNFIANTKPVAIVYIYDSAFQPRNKSQFIKKFINNHDVTITFGNSKFSNIFLSENKISIEEGYFLQSDKKDLTAIVFDSYRDSVSVRTPEQEDSLTINFMSSKRTQIINLQYMQLSTLIANIGAIIGNIFLIADYLVNVVNSSLFQNDLIRNLVNLVNTEEVNTALLISSPFKSTTNKQILGPKYPEKHFSHFKMRESQSKFPTNANIGGLNIIKQKKFQRNEVLPSHNEINTLNKSSTKTFQFSNPKIIFDTLCPTLQKISNKENKLNHILFSKLKDEVLQPKLEFINIFRKLQEFDLLKYLIFTDDQLQLLNLSRKPEIQFDQSKDDLQIKFSNNFSKYYFEEENQYLKSNKEYNQLLENGNFTSAYDRVKRNSDENINKRFLELFSE